MQAVQKIYLDPTLIARCFINVPNFKSVGGLSALLGKLYLKSALSPLTKLFCPKTHLIARWIKKCIDQKNNAWNYSNGGRLLRFACRNRWFKNILASGLKNIQSGTQEGEPADTGGEITPKVRIDKPWGWEVILTTVRERVGDAEEGYTEKYLIVAGPLSNQMHETYTEGGTEHVAKVETQTSYGPSPYLLRIGAGTEKEELYSLKPGGIFHFTKNLWHQPSVRPGHIAIIKETSKPNIGPGSTTRDVEGDPWRDYRSSEDK